MNLKISDKLLSEINARQYLYCILEEITHSKINNNLPEKITLNGLAESKEINTFQEIRHIRLNGYASEFLQYLYESSDPYFVPVIEMGQDGPSENASFTIQSNLGSLSKVLKGNGIITSPEKDLANDICYYRKQFIDACNKQDNKEYTRAYRAYLLCTTSIVECFLQRYIFYVLEKKPPNIDNEIFGILNSTKGLEIRIKAWLRLFTDKDESDLLKTKEWAHFIEIKRHRNIITHPNEPMVCYEVKEMLKIMNYLKYGIGGLFILLRKLEKGKEYIGFMRKIYNQSRIEIA